MNGRRQDVGRRWGPNSGESGYGVMGLMTRRTSTLVGDSGPESADLNVEEPC
ncbi:hypothetical protein RBWH47_04732 [Rhodopirellula baltica WH47]|uniref:Uncharacterized protein n=1 Tax=Rhodopirellula baltica WH47 TaxID=991778 RepID=F2AT84_RHOBT|nr:hypothetical protein RBWH47_04732 [Rhodopirellula baltica WH47]